ncbi:MAG: nitrate/nitrite transporter [Acidimicrobiales bacterium]
MTTQATSGAPAARQAPPLGARVLLTLGLVLLSSMVAQSFGRFTWPVLQPAVVEDLLGSLTRAGSLASISLTAYFLGAALVSWLSTRVDPTVLVKFGLVGSFAGLVLLTTANGFAQLGVGLFVAGLGSAGVWVPAPGIAAAMVGPERGGFAIGLVGSGIGLGIFVVGPLTNLVRRSAGEGAWRPVYLIEAAVAAVVLALVLAAVRRPAAAAGAPIERVKVSVLREVPGWGYLLAAFAAFGAGYSLFFYFFVTQLQDAGWRPSSTNLVSSLLGASSVFGGIVFGRVSDRYGRPYTMLTGFVIMAAAPLLALTAALGPVLVAAVGYGLCVAGTPTAIGAVVADHLRGRAFGAAFGSLTLVFSAAQLAGPQLAGIIADRTGSFVPAFAASSLLALVGAACAFALARRGPRPA